MEQGAICSLSEQDLGDVTYPYIQVATCTDALKDLAEHYRRSLDINFRQRRKDQYQRNDRIRSF